MYSTPEAMLCISFGFPDYVCKAVMADSPHNMSDIGKERIEGHTCAQERDAIGPDSELLSTRKRIIDAASLEELREQYLSSLEEAKRSFAREQNVLQCLSRIRAIRDGATERILSLTEDGMARDGFGPLPMKYCWVAVGSQGRGEETFFTDQDYLLIYEIITSRQMKGDPDDSVQFYIDEFCRRAVDMFHTVGVNRCKGGIVPSNQKWRGSVEMWKGRIERKCERFDHFLVDFFVLTDARPVVGETPLLDAVIDHLFLQLEKNNQILKEMAHLAASIPTVGLFGRLRVDSRGKNEGRINLKLCGRTPLVLCLQCLSLRAKIRETSSCIRIMRLEELKLLDRDLGRKLTDALSLFLKYRLLSETRKTERHELNYADPRGLDKPDLSVLKGALSAVKSLQKHAHSLLVPHELPLK
jgi:CBS domain-containing protein